MSAGVVAQRRGHRLPAHRRRQHYLSDVAVGAVMGTAFGLAVPCLFHADVLGGDLAVTPTANGFALGSF